VILHAPEHRYREQTLWRYPVLMDGERFMYENEDRRVRKGLPCAECGETLGYPIVFWIQMEDDLYMHPRCARHLAEGITGDLLQVAEVYGEPS
jgi:hypothetical protein